MASQHLSLLPFVFHLHARCIHIMCMCVEVDIPSQEHVVEVCDVGSQNWAQDLFIGVWPRHLCLLCCLDQATVTGFLKHYSDSRCQPPVYDVPARSFGCCAGLNLQALREQLAPQL